MPTKPSYPGVYVEEISSGVHPIVGVSTSVAAFIDFFSRGPIDEAIKIMSFGDFQRIFGGLDARSEASYAIQQFYLNGGQSAWVVRVGDTDLVNGKAFYELVNGTDSVLKVEAVNPGAWGNRLQVAVDYNTKPAGLFNLVVREITNENGKKKVVKSEVYRNLTMGKGTSRYAIDVVRAESSLIRLTDMNAADKQGTLPSTTIQGDYKDVIRIVNEPKADEPVTAANPHGVYIPLDGGSDGKLFDEFNQLKNKNTLAEAIKGDENGNTGMYALDRIEPFIFNILCIPAAAILFSDDADNYSSVYSAAQQYCVTKRAFLIMDIPEGKASVDELTNSEKFLGKIELLRSPNAAIYFPRLDISDPLNENRKRSVGASGTLAGIYARTDADRGVWKAPAGTEAVLRNASLRFKLNDAENGDLNSIGINAHRNFPTYGTISWGARTLVGADVQASEWKYIPVRRTALFIEESLYQGLKWVVFEPNAEPLWAQIRLNVGAFMHDLFRQGAFQGQSRSEAYFVRCDSNTTTQSDINNGIVNIVVGFAPLKPAEFVIVQLQQMIGQIEV